MAEAGTSVSDDLDVRLDRIEAAVAAGDTDLRALGFWRLVAEVKTDRILIGRHADRIGRIDTAAFRRAVRFRIPVWAGHTVLLVGAIAGGVAVWIAGRIDDATWAGILVIAAGADWCVSFHCPTHWLVGRFVDVRFTDYSFGGPPPPRPGLKTDYASYLRADPGSRAWMHASGAIATKLAPFLALALVPAVGAPWWAAAVLVVVGVGQIASDIAFSTKNSDWKRFIRERAVARARRSA
jgi:hypothetical protein